jgi:hypothetical protein
MDGNPYVDYDIHAVFSGTKETRNVNGFYDGNGEYVVRSMQDFEGSIVPQGTFTGHFRIVTGGRSYMAVRIQKVK